MYIYYTVIYPILFANLSSLNYLRPTIRTTIRR